MMNSLSFAVEYLEGLKRVIDTLPLDALARLVDQIENAHRNNRQIFVIGNGGSASTASHLSCDLAKNTFDPADGATVHRLRVMSLTDNVGWITALGNDLGYEHIFSEQLRNLVRPGDLVIVITGSGNSANILYGARVARELGATVFGLLGFDGGKIRPLLDDYLLVDSTNYGHIEDLHLVVNHILTAYFRQNARHEAGGVLLEMPVQIDQVAAPV